MQVVRKAIQLDESHNYEEALEQYKAATNLFLQVVEEIRESSAKSEPKDADFDDDEDMESEIH